MPYEPSDHRPGPVEWLTVPGRLLLIATIVGCAGVIYWYVAVTLPELPGGRHPVIMWVLPVLLGPFFFFIAAAFIMERLGIRIYRRDE